VCQSHATPPTGSGASSRNDASKNPGGGGEGVSDLSVRVHPVKQHTRSRESASRRRERPNASNNGREDSQSDVKRKQTLK
jgi:hypothetical protein